MTPWIKMRINLREDPRVRFVALRCCNGGSVTASVTAIVGALYTLWTIADQYSSDGTLIGYRAQDLDEMVGIRGLCDALADEHVRWLEIGPNSIKVLEFEKHNGEGAKKRGQTAARVAAHRSRNADVTDTALRERYQNQNQNQNQNSPTSDDVGCPEPAAADSGPAHATRRPRRSRDPQDPTPVLLTIPVVGNGPAEWPLHQSKLDEYAESFPAVDVLAAIRAARQWGIDNPTRRKTFNGTPAFLTGWLNRAQNSNQFRRGADGGASGPVPGNGRGPSPLTPTQSRIDQQRDTAARVAARFNNEGAS